MIPETSELPPALGPPSPALSAARQPGPPAARPQRTGWARAVYAGVSTAVVNVALVLTLGVLAFGALGAQAAQVGVPASFITVIVAGAVFALLAGNVLPAAGPSSATALLFAALALQLMDTPGAAGGPPLGALLAALACAVVGMGVLQLAMAELGLARLARFVPQPVLAGFMNGAALLILVSQLGSLLAAGQAQDGSRWPAVGSLGPLALALAVAAITWLLAWRAPRAPGALLAMLAGVAAYQWLQHGGAGLALGPTLGSVPALLPAPPPMALWQDAAAWDFVQRHAGTIGLGAVLLALIGSLESALSALALDQLTGERHDPRRVLRALALANIAGGACGGLPAVALRARALAMWQAGGSGARTALCAALASLALFALAGAALAAVPLAVLSGVMITLGVALIDGWSRGLLWRALRGRGNALARPALAIVAVVCVATLWLGLAAGVGVGVLLATLGFLRGLNRSLLRSRLDGAALPSRRVYPSALEQVLAPLRRRICVLELEGALFFGNAERLSDEAQTLAADCRFLVLDLRRVTTVDESGAMQMQQLAQRLTRRGVALLLSGLDADSRLGQPLRAFGLKRQAWFIDLDHAVEAAERALLHDAGAPDGDAEVPPAQSNLLRGLGPDRQARVAALLEPLQLAAGAHAFREGDPGDALYIVCSGSMSMLDPVSRRRLASLSAGTMFGEMAMLDGRGRSTDAVADRATELLRLPAHAIEQLAAQDPELARALYCNIAAHLAERLRSASAAWRAAAG